MFKFFAAFRKEWLILERDLAGLMLLFLMPMVMVIILSMVQEMGWSTISKEPLIPVLFINNDQDSLGNLMESKLVGSKTFFLVKHIDSIPVTKEIAFQNIKDGEYQIAIVISEGTTRKMRAKIQSMVTKTISSLTMPTLNFPDAPTNTDSIEVIIYFDPSVNSSFKKLFTSAAHKLKAQIESQMVLETFQYELRKMFPDFTIPVDDLQQTVTFTEIFPSGEENVLLPSTTQHNVPSWAIFAMFFIVIPLTSSIIKERDEGSLIRIMTIPVSYLTIFMAKIGVYLIVCFIQFVLMILAGIYLLPLFDMPPLELGTNYLGVAIMVIVTSMAALGYGVMIGTIAKTHQQAAAFGAVSIIILASLGGLWVPIYLMGTFMRNMASYTPLNWAHEGFIDLFLRGSTLLDVFPEIAKLLIFFGVTISIAAIYRTLKPPISA